MKNLGGWIELINHALRSGYASATCMIYKMYNKKKMYNFATSNIEPFYTLFGKLPNHRGGRISIEGMREMQRFW